MRYLILVLVVMLTGCINEDKPVANDPEAVIKAYFQAEADGDLTAYKGLVEKRMLSLSEDQLSSAMGYDTDKMRKGNGIKSIALRKKDFTDNFIRYHAVVTLNSGYEMNKSVAARNEAGQWKVVVGG
jgi:hypothetical protein